MQIFLDIGKLKERARMSGIPLKALCGKAGVNSSTPSRIARTGRSHTKTMIDLSRALHVLEREQLERLRATLEADHAA